MVSILTFPACKEKGCRNINAVNFDADAVKEDGSCEFLMVQEIKVNSIPSLNTDSTEWDTESTPDLLIVIYRESDPEAEKSNTLFNATLPGSLTFSSNVILTDEKWKYQLYDYDIPGPDQLISSGSFNPIDDKNGNEINLNQGASSIQIICKQKKI